MSDVADWEGREYRRVSALQEAMASEALSAVALRGDEAVLDLGCGDGRVTAALADRVPDGHVVGLDPSPGMIATARGELAGRTNLEFGEAAAGELADVDRFDVVVSFNVLHRVPEAQHPDVLRRVARALRRPGWALLQFVCGGAEPSVEDVAMQVTGRPRWRGWFTDFTAPYAHPDPVRFEVAAVGAGFTVRSAEAGLRTWDFDTADAFTDWCAAGFRDWTRTVPPDERRAFAAEVVDAYAEVSGSDRRLRYMQLRTVLDVG